VDALLVGLVMVVPTETRLETHRRQFVSDGMVGSLLKFEELTLDERTLISRDFSTIPDICRVFGLTRDNAGVWIFHSWGVMCPHPGYSRRPSISSDEWYDCLTCGCIVLNR